MNAAFFKQSLPACLAFGLVFAWIDQVGWPMQGWVIDLGRAFGASPMLVSGVPLVSGGGPFMGGGIGAAWWNWLYSHVIMIACSGSGFAAATGVYWLCARALGHTRVFGRRGPTLCGNCGYHLVGLTRPVCPECGQVI